VSAVNFGFALVESAGCNIKHQKSGLFGHPEQHGGIFSLQSRAYNNTGARNSNTAAVLQLHDAILAIKWRTSTAPTNAAHTIITVCGVLRKREI